MFESYKNRMAVRGRSTGDMLRKQSNMVVEQTWDRDPNARKVYVVRADSGLPKVTEENELIDCKFNVKTYENITSDKPSYWMQFRHGEEKRHPEIAVGSYIYMENEDHEWEWWLLVDIDSRPMFRQWQILQCNWTFGWVVDGKIYHCLGIHRVQASYNSGSLDGDRFTFVDNITSAWLPTNHDTITINYNQRFLISDPRKPIPMAWTVSKYEDVQPLGLIKLKFTQETFDPSHDNAELMLANYYDSEIEPIDINQQVCTKQPVVITYSGTKPEIKVGGNFKTFTPDFHNETTTVSQWAISDESGDISGDTNYTIEYADNQMKLKIARNYNLIGKVLVVKATGSDGSAGEIKIEVVG